MKDAIQSLIAVSYYMPGSLLILSCLPQNKRYRKIVEDKKVEYINSKRLDKPLVALNIIKEWRAQDPPGRFLKVDDRTGLWNDVGDKKAREKTSQALREKAPLLRKQQEEEKTGSDSGDDGVRMRRPSQYRSSLATVRCEHSLTHTHARTIGYRQAQNG